jgi:hypothetical protein
MTTSEIANRLYELCQQGQFGQAQDELYAATATSTEPDMTGTLQTAVGLDAIKEKSREFESKIVETHGGYTKEPKVFGKHIFMELGLDVTMKDMGRMDMKEMCHYIVSDGKIISEQFYY